MKKKIDLSIKKNSKSFYFAGLFLPSEIFNNCSVLYSFCRMVDDISDKKIKNKKEKLKKIINSINKNINFNNINSKNIYNLIKKDLIQIDCLLELLKGMLIDTKKVHFINISNLINYSYLVAGTVGIMMAKILGNKNIYAFKYAVDLGIAMQLTNIMRDILEDARMDRVYLPKSWIKVKAKDILNQNAKTRIKLIRATDKLFILSNKYYESAFKGLAFLPLKSRFTILLALLVYKKIGQNIINKNYTNLYKREIVSLIEKLFCLAKAIFILLFNLKLHFKKYNHDYSLHLTLSNNSYLKKKLYE